MSYRVVHFALGDSSQGQKWPESFVKQAQRRLSAKSSGMAPHRSSFISTIAEVRSCADLRMHWSIKVKGEPWQADRRPQPKILAWENATKQARGQQGLSAAELPLTKLKRSASPKAQAQTKHTHKEITLSTIPEYMSSSGTDRSLPNSAQMVRNGKVNFLELGVARPRG